MEQRYYQPGQERFVTDNVDFNAFFNDFGKSVFSTFSEAASTSLQQLVGMSDDEARKMERLTSSLLPPIVDQNDGQSILVEDEDEDIKVDTDVLVPKGYDKERYFIQDPPKAAYDALCSLKRANTCSKRKLYYTGEVDLSNIIAEERATYQKVSDLVPYGYFILNVRVHFPVLHTKYTNLSRARILQASQEFMCCSSTRLSVLRDRISCANDFQPTDGDISENHLRTNPTTAGELHPSGMFYIGNDFYIDCRPANFVDYSEAIIKWGQREGFQFGRVRQMEETTIGELGEIRLGWPYLYRHLADCEHLIIFTDARLLHPLDPMDSSKYPFMETFASLKGRYCFACHVRIAKFLVTNNPRLPEEVAFMCQACFESFNYKSGEKIGSFKTYGYVDRTALL
ncbi:snRNA-activating protein complex subunit [Nesidiocoris tenuis]|uniref:snRNA-activating protein complex subunit 3 n=1 Tax=Nesidiocoris tenuis TaxID=355587 RepID=A0ABN7AWR0_9HEMI|nr:snRNA-activating protein complex subunit [Nesidiocoris tenuis]